MSSYHLSSYMVTRESRRPNSVGTKHVTAELLDDLWPQRLPYWNLAAKPAQTPFADTASTRYGIHQGMVWDGFDVMEIEIEHTYLLSELPKQVLDWKKETVVDKYFPSHAPHPQIRLRDRNGKRVVTKKYPLGSGDYSRMVEETIVLDDLEYEFMNSSIEGLVLAKERFMKELDGVVLEVDRYLENLDGLVVLDVELSAQGSISSVNLDDFPIIKEITQTELLAAGMLAGRTFAEVSRLLE